APCLTLEKFEMKKSLIALAVLAASGAAMAQSSVTLYGRLDVGMAQQTTETTGAAPVASLSKNLVTSSTLNTTYWGMMGTEDLGGGLKANFNLQQQFAVDTGAASNTLFEREAWVGLSGGFGAVQLGRNYTAYDDIRGATNNLSNTNIATTGTVFAGGLADYSTRTSNSIRYNSPVFGGVSGALVYGLGENKTAGTSASDIIGLNIKYAAGPLMVGYAHQEEKQVQASALVAQVTRKYDYLGATYDLGVAKLVAGYDKSKDGSFDDKGYQLGAVVPVGSAATVQFGYAKGESAGAGKADLSSKGFTLAGTYSLSKRTTLYAGYVNTEVEKGTVGAISTDKVTTVAAGVRHTF
ncbi:porin, partial [bacterium]|nr:porin [bacterium]